jgi:hypothetical protein
MRSIPLILGLCTILGHSFAEIGPTPGTQLVAPVFARADLVCNCTFESVRVVDEHRLERAGKAFTLRRVVATVRVK